MKEWKEYKIGDVFAYLKSGKGIHANEISSKGEYPVFGGNGLRGYTTRNNFEGDCAIIGRQGAFCGNVRYFKGKAYMTEHAIIAVANENNSTRFLAYLLGIMNLGRFSGQSAQPGLSVTELAKQSITVPSLSVQKKIATILSSLDNKIELNRRINRNLEQQAQALFKAWFVDFEPFKNGKFVDSELGKIPEGWRVGQLDELIEIKYGKDHKKILSGNIPVYGSGGIMRYVNMPIYEKESVLIPRKGSLNNVLYVNHPFWTVDTMFYTRMKINGIAKFIYLFISPIDLLSMNSGSAVPSMTTDILNKIRLVIPPKNIFDKFESLIAPFFDKIGSCNKEICKLSNLRDALLPKLMSGELSINTITE